MAKKEAEQDSLGEVIRRHHERATGEPLKLGEVVVYTGDREGMVTVTRPREDGWQAPEPPQGEGIL